MVSYGQKESDTTLSDKEAPVTLDPDLGPYV